MRSKIWSKIIVFVFLCLVPKYSVVCIDFEEDDGRIGMDPLGTENNPFGFFGDLMPPSFAKYASLGRRGSYDNFDDIERYNKGEAANDNEEDFRSYIGNVYNSNPKVKNMFDILKPDSDIDYVTIHSSDGQNSGDMDYDDDDDDDDEEGNRGKVVHPSMELIRRISPSWDKSNQSDSDDNRLIGKSASMKDSISRLIGIGHKSSTASPDESDGESKKDAGDSNDDDDDDDDNDSEDGESNKKTTKMDGKSKGNLFSKLFSKSKTTSSDMDHKTTTEASKSTTEKSFASNLTAASDKDNKDDDDGDDYDEESGDNSTSSSHTSTTTKSSKSVSTTVFTTTTPLSPSTTDSTSTTSTTKKGKSHKHKEASSTSTTPAPDNITSTEKVTKKHHKSHTSTITMPSTTFAQQTSHDSITTSPKNTKDTDNNDDHGNKTDHKSSVEIIEDFLAGLGHKKDNHTSTEAPTTKSTKHSKNHKKKHGKSKNKKTTTVPPESISTAMEETGSNSSSTTEKPDNKSTTGTEVSTTIRPKGDTTTARSTSTTDSSASFPVISITRATSNEKYLTTDSSTTHASSNNLENSSKSTSTTPIPTLGPYVEDSDDILITTESIIYSDWNPDVFP